MARSIMTGNPMLSFRFILTINGRKNKIGMTTVEYKNENKSLILSRAHMFENSALNTAFQDAGEISFSVPERGANIIGHVPPVGFEQKFKAREFKFSYEGCEYIPFEMLNAMDSAILMEKIILSNAKLISIEDITLESD